jgi:heat shock protein HslJ
MIAVVAVLGVAGCSWTSNDTKSATAGLPDTKQQLTAYEWLLDRSDSSLTANDTTATTLTFAADHLVFGSAPCNLYRGKFAIDKDTVEISAISAVSRACPDGWLNTQACAPAGSCEAQTWVTPLTAFMRVAASRCPPAQLAAAEGSLLAQVLATMAAARRR